MQTTHNGFSAREDRSDGLDLRGAGWAGETLFDRLYFALRDPWWRTIDLAIVDRSVVVTPTGFQVAVAARSTWPSHPAQVELSYAAEGTELVARVRATALGEFDYPRIGFCLLLGAEQWRGRPARSWRGGALTELTFPDAIVTRDQHDEPTTRFHTPFEELAVTAATGTVAHYTFAGAPFEFEDQRNWTDASYKAYPVFPGPRRARAGETFEQSVHVRVTPAVLPRPRPAPGGGPIVVGAPIGVVPPVDLFRGRAQPRSYRPGGGFAELNARRPGLAGADGIELGLNGAVHATDDDSVMQTALMHGALLAQVHGLYPGVPVTLAPVSFLDRAGDWRDPAGDYAPQPPVATGGRAWDEFGAAWILASAASTLPVGPAAVHYLDAAVPTDSPAGRAVAWLASLRGATLLGVSAPAPLAALAVGSPDGVILVVTNTSPDPVGFTCPDGSHSTVDGFRSASFPVVSRV